MAEPESADVRYTAFLSYSHRDSKAAARLHRRLESFRTPRRLVGTEGKRGPVPERLWPIFRDREELPAASDLTETVREALARSGALIVLCSPNAAPSLWVAEEIRLFRELHPDRPVLAAILEGDPPDSFPPALRDFGQDGTWHEPLATDLRPQADGERLGLLKLVAGITGVGLDDLVQRDATRRIRRVTAVTATALFAVLLMTGLTVFAFDARGQAERERSEAEGLIEFMLTDLRDRLKGVGRLQIMDEVNRRALSYYGAQEELSTLSEASLVRRARVLLAMGEDDLSQDNYAEALAAFREAHRTTNEQLARAPDDPERIFAHSQSEFYLGRSNYERRNYSAARQNWQRYKALANRLVALDPRNANWVKEAAFAEGSLCTVTLEGQRDIPGALHSCTAALATMERAASISGTPAEYRSDLANRHAYVGDALEAAGRMDQALLHQRERLALLELQLDEDPHNARVRARRVWALRSIANIENQLGRKTNAEARMQEGIRILSELVRADPANVEWERELESMRTELVNIQNRRS